MEIRGSIPLRLYFALVAKKWADAAVSKAALLQVRLLPRAQRSTGAPFDCQSCGPFKFVPPKSIFPARLIVAVFRFNGGMTAGLFWKGAKKRGEANPSSFSQFIVLSPTDVYS